MSTQPPEHQTRTDTTTTAATIHAHGTVPGSSSGPAGIAYSVTFDEPGDPATARRAQTADPDDTHRVTNAETITTGHVSDTQAVYLAVQHALERALRLGVTDVTVVVMMDRVATQVAGDAPCQSSPVVPYRNTVRDLLDRFETGTIRSIPVEANTDVVRQAINAAPSP